jgi:hypothetical protein
MKLIQSIKQIISEASKKKILMDKIGFNEHNATILDELCGPLSVWMAKKFIDQQQENRLNSGQDRLDDEKIIKIMNNLSLLSNNIQKLQSIMDWIRVGLNGNVKPYKDSSLNELLSLSKQWHDSLEVGQGDINYKEPHTHDIILDFRDNNGNGFYWVALNTKNSSEECNRMGHCGRSSYGYLYSLRQVVPLNNKYKLNKSVLTAAIGEDGIMYQLKGAKNSKPEDKYHQYILPLFYVLGGGGEEDDYLIQGFGSEYASEQDFKLTDLPEETIKELYQNRPDLFNTRPLQRLLDKMGIIELEPIPTTFTLEIKPENFEDYIDGGWDNTYTNRTTGTKRRVSIFTEIMAGDSWELWSNDGYEDIGSYFQYTIDNPTEERLWDIVRRMAQRDGIELDEDLDLEDAIKEVDDDWEIRNAISSAINDADADDYVNYLQNQVKSALEEYGNVYEFDDTGAKIQVDISDFVDIDDQEIDDVFENFIERNGRYDLDGILRELLYLNYIDKPKFNYDERWYPSPDNRIVNEQVNYRLDDINI